MKSYASFAAVAVGICLVGSSALAAPAPESRGTTVTGGQAAKGTDGWFSAAPTAQRVSDPQRILGVTFYTQEGQFSGACGNPLTLEDFEDCSQNGIVGCPGAPFDSNTNNACFDNCIAPGLVIDALSNHQVYIGPSGFFGSTSKYVGADFFVDSFDVKFVPPVVAASMKAHLIFVGGTMNVTAYGADYTTVIGTTTMNAGPDAGTFIGAIANGGDLIGRLNFFDAQTGWSEGGDDIKFGFCGPYCGDGTVDQPNSQGVFEQCDDGNNINGDHCDSNCQIELYCGDGAVNVDCEACDDGNNVSGDGCSCDCINESSVDICDIVRALSSPQLPGGPVLPSSHACYQAPGPIAPVAGAPAGRARR